MIPTAHFSDGHLLQLYTDCGVRCCQFAAVVCGEAYVVRGPLTRLDECERTFNQKRADAQQT
jgi:hypothetical protein